MRPSPCCAQGVEAVRCDWALGRTVVVPGGGVEEHDGIRIWDSVAWIVEEETAPYWSVAQSPGVKVSRYASLWEACQAALRIVNGASDLPSVPDVG